mmetsp:Transcript_66098/g.149205  ORF Transcript_66098/g.149205 Transcript_66098/m.149205 type:complete len:305 (-) Transcript_66098:453-1367(-)
MRVVGDAQRRLHGGQEYRVLEVDPPRDLAQRPALRVEAVRRGVGREAEDPGAHPPSRVHAGSDARHHARQAVPVLHRVTHPRIRKALDIGVEWPILFVEFPPVELELGSVGDHTPGALDFHHARGGAAAFPPPHLDRHRPRGREDRRLVVGDLPCSRARDGKEQVLVSHDQTQAIAPSAVLGGIAPFGAQADALEHEPLGGGEALLQEGGRHGAGEEVEHGAAHGPAARVVGRGHHPIRRPPREQGEATCRGRRHESLQVQVLPLPLLQVAVVRSLDQCVRRQPTQPAAAAAAAAGMGRLEGGG